MSIIATLRCWWKAVVNRTRIHSEVDEELQFHIDAYVQDLIRQGMAPEEAERKARIEIGRPDTQHEKYRDAIGLRAFDELGADIRHGVRSLFKNPGFSAVAILSLALGIGATTAMFSLVYAALIHPFPYADSDRIMNPALINENRPDERRWFALYRPQFATLAKAKSLEGLLGFRTGNAEITGGDLPEDVSLMYLTENADTFLGVRALLGRGIQPSDASNGGQPVVVLNYRFWQRHFQGDSSVIGRALQINDENYTIVGVMPRAFAFNDTVGTADVYLPFSLVHDSTNPPIPAFCTPWMKLRADVSWAAASKELDAIVHQFAKENPRHFPDKFHLQLQPIVVPYERNTGHALMLLLAGVLLLLMIGCANCSILLLARGEARQHELAVRSAIGASRWRIIRQLLVGSLVISFSGAMLGVAASYWLAKLPLQLAPHSFPPESVIRINLPILAFSVGLAVLCGLLFGLTPALRLSRPDLARTMQVSIRRVSGNGSRRKINLLIAGQLTLTLLLLATAGTAISAFLHLTQVPLGYDPNHVMDVGVIVHWSHSREQGQVQSWEGRAALIDQFRQKIAAIPGVMSVAVGTDSLPPYSGVEYPMEVFGKTNRQQQEGRVHFVSPEYFATLRIPVVRGRIWDQSENVRGDSITIVNEAFVREYWPGQNPLGQQLRLPTLKPQSPLVKSSAESTDWRQVIGVIADLRNDGVDRPAVPAIYVPYTTLMPPYAQFDIRTQGEPLALLHSIREAVHSVASDQQISNGASDLKEDIERDAQWTRQRLFSILFGFFSGMALVLALVGLFSVVSYGVAQRTAEFGVRMALGASRGHILWVAARVALLSLSAGIAAGVLVDLFVGKILARWMENTGFGARSLLEATLLLSLCAIVACLLPAQRAASVDPVEALRYE